MTGKRFIFHIIGIILFFIGILFFTLIWLRFYTNHGQKIKMPNYISMSYKGAEDDAYGRGFEMIITDSIQVIGKSGGLVLHQNPKGGSWVKSGRKIYVRVSKYSADVIMSQELPVIYGKPYDILSRDLKNRGFSTEIINYKYDGGTEGVILEAFYKNQVLSNADNPLKQGIKLDKGSKLQFVVSKAEGAEVEVPDLIGKTFSAAKFIIETQKLNIGEIIEDGEILDRNNAIIIEQDPSSDGAATIRQGGLINITVRQE